MSDAPKPIYTPMIKAERFPDSWVHSRADTKGVFCSRQRCNNLIPLELKEMSVFNSVAYELPYDAVVISKDGGDNRYYFCSDKCAASWLTAHKR